MHPPTLSVILVLASVSLAAAQADNEALARRLLNTQGCRACHPFEARGNFPAPELTQVGARLGKEPLRQKLVNPGHRHANGRIADFSHLRTSEIDALVAFLGSRK